MAGTRWPALLAVIPARARAREKACHDRGLAELKMASADLTCIWPCRRACKYVLAGVPPSAVECRFARVVPVLIFPSPGLVLLLCWRKDPGQPSLSKALTRKHAARVVRSAEFSPVPGFKFPLTPNQVKSPQIGHCLNTRRWVSPSRGESASRSAQALLRALELVGTPPHPYFLFTAARGSAADRAAACFCLLAARRLP